MPRWREFIAGFSKRETDLDRELQAHLDLEAEERCASDTASAPDKDEARFAALRAFGNSTRVKEDVREAWGFAWFERLVQDSRYGLRQLRKDPGFTVVAILTLALGIGANTAIFTLVNAIMLQPLPVADPGRLYSLGDTKRCCDTTDFADISDNFALYSYPLYQHLRDHSRDFAELAAFQSQLQNVSIRRSGFPDAAQPYIGEFVSGNYFSTLGVNAAAGRALTPADDRPNAAPVVVMSYRAWHLRYGSDRAMIGGPITIDGVPATVVGVTPPSFFGDSLRGDPPDFWVPLSMEPTLSKDDPLLNQADEYWLYVLGRLQPGTAPAQAQVHLLVETQQWLRNRVGLSQRDQAAISNLRMTLSPAGRGVNRLRGAFTDGLRLLTFVSALVLLIACANIANLLLARSTSDRLRTALRVALGAARARLIRQKITEGVILALIGGSAGVALAFLGTRAILRLAFRGTSYIPIDATPSLPVLAFTFFLSLLTGILFSVAPAWVASFAQPAEALRGAGRSTPDRSALPQQLLVVVQAGLSVVLLVAAGLMAISLRNLQNQRLGFEPQGRLIVKISPVVAGYTPEQLPALYRQVQDRFSRIPGVQSASIALESPLGGNNFGAPVFVEGRAPAANPLDDNIFYDFVSAHFFQTIGTRLLRGRALDEQDTPNSRHVAVVNEAFARKFFPSQDPIGKHIGLCDLSHSGDYEIVGIAEDSKFRNLSALADSMVFLPLLQLETYKDPSDAAYQVWASYIEGIQLHVSGSPESYDAVVRQTIAAINPNLTVIKLFTFDGAVASSLNSQRLVSQLATLYGILALVLAAIGLYGVAACTVARRSGEIGIRMALGAQRSTVLAMILRNTMRPIAVGLLIGVPAAVAASRAVANQLFGVKSYDPIVFTAAILALTISSAVAAIVPARRAATIDPVIALRQE